MKKNVLILLICFIFLFGCSNNNSVSVNYMQAKEKIINEGDVLDDVRTQEEYDERPIAGAILLTLDDINEDSVNNVIDNKDTVIIVYCKSGVRSSQAVSELNDLGYENVFDLGAMSNWKE